MKSRKGIMSCLLGLWLGISFVSVLADPIIRHFVRGSFQEIVASRTGKPFIVSLWSLDCTYCFDDMEIFGRLLKKHQGLDLVLISTDATEQVGEIAKVLQKYPLKQAESWVFADSFAERLRYEIDRQWYGELPRTYFYNAQGHAIALSGRLTQAQIESWIRSTGKKN